MIAALSMMIYNRIMQDLDDQISLYSANTGYKVTGKHADYRGYPYTEY